MRCSQALHVDLGGPTREFEWTRDFGEVAQNPVEFDTHVRTVALLASPECEGQATSRIPSAR